MTFTEQVLAIINADKILALAAQLEEMGKEYGIAPQEETNLRRLAERWRELETVNSQRACP